MQVPMQLPLLCVMILALLCSGHTLAADLSFWHCNADGKDDQYAAAVTQFTRETGISVDSVNIDCADLGNRLRRAIAVGTAPDVALAHSRWAAVLADQQFFADLGPYVKADKSPLWDDLRPSATALWRNYKGQLAGISLSSTVTAMYYNRRLFAEYGIAEPTDASWEAVLTDAVKLTRDVSGDGLHDVFGMTEWWFDWQPVVWAYGGDFVNADRSGSALGSQSARNALMQYRQFFAKAVFPVAADWRRLGQASAAALWQSGAVAMAPAGFWLSDCCRTSSDALSDFAAVAELPKAPSGRRASAVDGWALTLLNSSSRKDAAFRLISYLQEDRFLQMIMPAGIPAHRRLDQTLVNMITPSSSATDVLLRTAEYAQPFPKGFDWWGKVWPVVNRYTGSYFTGSMSLDAALVQISTQVKSVLARDEVRRTSR